MWDKKQLELTPKFQRRQVWDYRVKSYFLDSIIRGFSTPKIYLRETIHKKSKFLIREVVDGQQRLRAILDFLDGKLTISPRDNEIYGDTPFKSLPPDAQRDFLDYGTSVDVMRDASDEEVLQMFARLNTYTVRLNRQELRNARYHGEFKTTAYRIANEHVAFFQTNGVLSAKQIMRMADAELVSELLVAMLDGLQDKKKSLDKFYRHYDKRFDKAEMCMKRFRETIRQISRVCSGELRKTRFRRKTLFYSIFCVFYDIRFGLPSQRGPYGSIPEGSYEAARKELVHLSEQIETEVPSDKYVKFFAACKQQTDNKAPRQIRHDTILEALRPLIVASSVE